MHTCSEQYACHANTVDINSKKFFLSKADACLQKVVKVQGLTTKQEHLSEAFFLAAIITLSLFTQQ